MRGAGVKRYLYQDGNTFTVYYAGKLVHTVEFDLSTAGRYSGHALVRLCDGEMR